MSSFSQPSFWLDVRKEYVITNFERLLIYLRDYNYSSDKSQHSDFNKTFDCLKELTREILTQNNESDLCKYHSFDRIDDRKLVRIVAAYLLTCEKKDKSSNEQLSQLIDRLLLINEGIQVKVLEGFRAMLLACTRQQRVEKYGFDWSYLINAERFRIDQFCLLLCATRWKPSTSEDPHIVEQNGLALFDQNRLHLSTLNFGEYRRQTLEEQISLGQDILLELPNNKHMSLKVPADYQLLNSTLEGAQSSMRPTIEPKMKEYDLSHEFVHVKVVSKENWVIQAETIDPDFIKVKGGVLIEQLPFVLDRTEINRMINVGDVLLVKFHQERDGYAFSMLDCLKKTYKSVAEYYIDKPLQARFMSTYGKHKNGGGYIGSRWMSEVGVQVNVYGDMGEFAEKAEQGEFVKVSIDNCVPDSNGNYVANGRFYYDQREIDDIDAAEFEANAKNFLFNEYLDDSEPEDMPLRQMVATKKLAYTWLRPFARLLYHYSIEAATSTLERFQYLSVARFISNMVGCKEDLAVIDHEIRFLKACVDFASGVTPSEIKSTLNQQLHTNHRMLYQDSIVSCLQSYKERLATSAESDDLSDEQVKHRVDDLVKASNILVGKISNEEHNRIKKSIAQTLEVGDMFVSSLSNVTHYGVESETLEFKTSIVFPPINRRTNTAIAAEPERQKWAILRTVCAFLNSLRGGELLLGVNDRGFANGLNEDIKYLFEHNHIKDRSTDDYLRYIKYHVDNVFIDPDGVATQSGEITFDRVKYYIETNAEGEEIVRISVSPYEYGVVRFTKDAKRPTDIADSYVRSSNTSVPITDELKNQLQDKKRKHRSDDITIKILQLKLAKKQNKAVLLKSYSSSNGIADREVEVYRVMLEKQCLIGFDLREKALRTFRLSRFKEVVLTNRKWKHFKQNFAERGIDLFGILQGDAPAERIVLKLKPLPYNLLVEEFAQAEKFVRLNDDPADKDAYPWVLDTEVWGMQGIGRFYIGLAQLIKIVEGDSLRDYALEYMKKVEESL
ncbi:MAG: putative DNA binding domain-containing protein [Bacteroidaceae bacterium]|nr:putative DNA binding domain-containing protein [Bacteroidaceae bacterium]